MTDVDEPELPYKPSEHPFPETAQEVRIVMDLVWGDHPELETIGDVRAVITEKLNAMRQARDDLIATQNANGERYEASRVRGYISTHMTFDEGR